MHFLEERSAIRQTSEGISRSMAEHVDNKLMILIRDDSMKKDVVDSRRGDYLSFLAQSRYLEGLMWLGKDL